RGTTRIYSRLDRARLKLLLLGKRAGFSLAEIKEMLDLYDLNDGGATQRRATLVKCREQKGFLEQQIQEMLQAIEELKETCQVIERIQRERGELE
ncbi:MAG: MerR family DNA-binding protein, partial [Hyphomicrobiales bacterium]|nr:MerR family DNA-binding protein [Hyphomicrobiales bacterium]